MTNARAEITRTVTIDLDVQEAAKWFAALNDEEQAQFFIEVAKEASEWEHSPMGMGAQWQWISIGKHLKTCPCATEDARDLILSIAYGIENTTEAA